MLDFKPINQPNFPLKSLAAAVALAFGMVTAHATTFTVDGANCTLPDAVKAASTNTAVGGCPAGGAKDTLNLSATNYTLTTAADSINDNGLWPISGTVTINGKPGVGSVIRRSKAVTQAFRIFQVNKDGILTLNYLTVQNGKSDGVGGGILNYGKLTLTHSIVSGNTGGGINSFNYDTVVILTNSRVSDNSGVPFGGGIVIGGTLTLTNSIVSDNSAGLLGGIGGGINSQTFGSTVTLMNSTVSGNSASKGGGIYSGGGAALTMANSTVSGNSAGYHNGTGAGGGIYSQGSNVTLTNTTVSGNKAGINGGGGIFASGSSLTLISSTVSDNSSGSNGAGINASGLLTLANSIIANSKLGSDCIVYGSESIIHKGKNLIEDGSCNVVDQGGLQVDPKLGLLLDNGGPTRTHALLPDSIAINAADTVLPKQFKDQRGAKRPQGFIVTSVHLN